MNFELLNKILNKKLNKRCQYLESKIQFQIEMILKKQRISNRLMKVNSDHLKKHKLEMSIKLKLSTTNQSIIESY